MPKPKRSRAELKAVLRDVKKITAVQSSLGVAMTDERPLGFRMQVKNFLLNLRFRKDRMLTEKTYVKN